MLNEAKHIIPGITLLGLGPGDPALLTRHAWSVLESASEVHLRTRQHPATAGLPAHLQIHSFDHLYEEYENAGEVYTRIVEEVLNLGRRPQGVIYAVPGHPFVAEATSPEIARRARQEGIPLRVVDGMSFLEPAFTALGVDPFPHTALVDALELAIKHVPLFPPDTPAMITQLYSSHVASEVKLVLMAQYPDEHPVRLIHAAGTEQELIENLALYEIDRSPHVGLLTALYVPALDPSTSFEAFQEVIARLRAPDGCPWDREQTHKSLRTSLLEETYEALAAIDGDNPLAMQEELGDLLLQIVLQAQIATDNGEFSMADVLQGIHTKIVRRHPHVFGDLELKDAQAVIENWERLKAAERAAGSASLAAESGERGNIAQKGLLDGVPPALPALAQAGQYQQRVARVGFDWPDIHGVWEKLEEELGEVKSAQGNEALSAEIGDLLFAVANLARWYKIDSESALRQANNRFRRRFSSLESEVRTQGRKVSDLSLEEMDALWQGR